MKKLKYEECMCMEGYSSLIEGNCTECDFNEDYAVEMIEDFDFEDNGFDYIDKELFK